MDLVTGIKERRSIRRFREESVPHEVFAEIVNTAAWAPSWKNSQIVRYMVIEDKEKMKQIAENCVVGFTYNTKTISGAAALVLLTYVTGRSGYEKDGSYTTPKHDEWEMFDAGIAAQTFCLAAHEKGVGTVIMGIFDEEKVAEVVKIPEGQKIGALIAAGYPAGEKPAAPPRKDATQLLTFV